MELAGSRLLLLLALVFLALHHDQYKLVVRSDQNLVLCGLQSHEFELVVRIQVADGVLGLRHQLGNQSGQRVP